jgi:hypothetical protein
MSQLFFWERKIREEVVEKVASIKYQEIGYEVPRRLYEVLSTRYQDLFGGESRFQSGFPTSTFDTRRSSFDIREKQEPRGKKRDVVDKGCSSIQ